MRFETCSYGKPNLILALMARPCVRPPCGDTLRGMRGFVLISVVLAGAGSVAGCGSSGTKSGPAGAALDCAWLAGNNCWKTTTNLAAACLPPSTESGVLNASATACTYPSGAMVTFNVPLMLTSVQPTYDFSVTGANGQPCLTFKSMDKGGFTLDVKGQTVTSAPNGTGFTMTCPDGTKYNGQVGDLLSCSDASLSSILPSYGFLSGSTYKVSLSGTADPSTGLTLFSCGAANGGGLPRYNDCTITGGTGTFPPNLCVDYTGSGNTGLNGNAAASSACQTLAATCGSGCQNTFSALGTCANSPGPAHIGSCVVSGGQPLEQTVRFYPPTTSAQAQTYCAGLGGVFSSV